MPQGDRDGIPWRSRLLQTVLASTLVLPLGVPLLSPLLPLYGEVFVISDLRASLLISGYFLPIIVLSPLFGIALDRLGRRPVLVVSLAAFGLLGIGMMLTTTFTQFLVVRLAQGAAAAGVFCATVTIIADGFEGANRSAVFGINVAVLATGRAVYPVLGGGVAGFGWNVPFVMYGFAVLVAGFVYLVFTEPDRDAPDRSVSARTNTLAAFNSETVPWLIAATIAAEVLTFGAIFTSVPFLLDGVFAADPLTVGAALTAATIASALVAAANGRMVHRFSSPRLVAVGFVCFGVSLLGIAFAPTVLVLATVGVLFGAGIGLVLPSVDAAISDTIRADLRASAMSLRNSATGIGKAAGPVLFTAIAPTVGYRSLMLVAGAGTLLVGIIGVRLAPR